LGKYTQIAKVNLKNNLLPHLLISFVMLGLSPLLMGVENLNAANTAKVLEMYVALIGIILLTPIFLPEQNKDLKELVEAKFTTMSSVYIVRVCESLICLMILVGGYIFLLQHNSCSFPVMKFFLGTLSEAIFLGGMGLFTYSLFDQIAIAYMLPIMFYILSIGGGKKLMKDYYLFSMIYGGFEEKVYLVITGLLMISMGIAFPYLFKRIKPKLARHKTDRM